MQGPNELSLCLQEGRRDACARRRHVACCCQVAGGGRRPLKEGTLSDER